MADPTELSTGALQVGRVAEVSVPATSANLGPGFDCFGLALDWRERVRLEVLDQGFEVAVTGEGADTIPRDASHLIIATALSGLADLGISVPGLRVSAHNTIPHGRGLGSSSAAIVAGLVAARSLAGARPDPDWVFERAAAIEGHPDNVAAAVYGGFVLAYEVDGRVAVSRSRSAPSIGGMIFVADHPVETRTARGLLPDTVPHHDAAANSGRAALFVHAMADAPELLSVASRDWLHQEYRRSAMPESYVLMTSLREQGWAAMISGAGPSVLVLGPTEHLALAGTRPGFAARTVAVGRGAEVLSAAGAEETR